MANATATIYIIRNTASSRPDACYVGSSVRMNGARKRQHLALLRRDVHHSLPLQKAFNKYGETAFVFSALETCAADVRFDRESHWIGILRPRYNVAFTAGSVTGLRWSLSPETKRRMSDAAQNRSEEHRRKLKEARAHQVLREPRKLTKMNMPGWRHTEESKAKISDAIRRRGAMPQETRDKISAFHKGKPKSPETRAKLSEAAKRREVTPERLALLRRVNIGRRYSDETNAKRSRSAKETHARDPDLRRRQVAIRKANKASRNPQPPADKPAHLL